LKVLILSVTAGYGHHAAARAVSDALESRGASVLTVDMFKYASKALYDTVDKGYLFSTKYIPKPYGQIYSALEKNRQFRRRTLSMLVTDLIASKFSGFIEDFAPDVIVCSHIFCAMVMDELKSREKLFAPVVSILTDYTFHPFWDDIPRVDYIVTGSEFLGCKAKKKGIEAKRLLPFGIPVNPKFSNKLLREEARAMFGLDPAKFTLLCMSGSMGFGHMVKTMQNLDSMKEDFQILCVCGKNEKIFKRLSKIDFKKDVKIFGFVDNVDQMLDAADCIVTKPGGLTTTECMQKRLPMILTDPIPGQEDRNAEFFVNLGAAVQCSKYFPVDEAVYLLYHSPERMIQMVEALNAISPADPSAKLADFILGLA
jgi:processive 1,2-diacylglycerol beta-glucosyltransferase